MSCDLDVIFPCPGNLLFFIDHDYKHNSVPLDEIYSILTDYFGIPFFSMIPRLVHAVMECSDFSVVETYNHIKTCKYQSPMTEPIPGDYLLTPSMDYADALSSYVEYLVSFIELIRPDIHLNPRKRDHFTHRHYHEDH